MFLIQNKVSKTSKLGKSQNFRGILVGLTENALRNSGDEASKKIHPSGEPIHVESGIEFFSVNDSEG